MFGYLKPRGGRSRPLAMRNFVTEMKGRHKVDVYGKYKK